MKVYTRIVISIKTGEVLYEDSYDYSGPVVLAGGSGGGGSTTSTTIDYAYNDRMARISEKQQLMADKYFKFWETDYMPMEREQIAANRKLIPYQTNVEVEGYKQALRSMDPELIEQEAKHDVGIAFTEADDATRRELGRMGLDPTSKKAMGAMASGGLAKAKTTAAAMKDTLTMTKQGDKYVSGEGGLPTTGATPDGTTAAGTGAGAIPTIPAHADHSIAPSPYSTGYNPTGWSFPNGMSYDEYRANDKAGRA